MEEYSSIGNGTEQFIKVPIAPHTKVYVANITMLIFFSIIINTTLYALVIAKLAHLRKHEVLWYKG